jgi:hypothetical protein
MEDQNKQNKEPLAPVNTGKKKGFFANWLNSLIGKPSRQTVSVEPQPEGKDVLSKNADVKEEDSVAEDIKHLKTFTHHVEEKLNPFVKKGKEKSGKVVTSAAKVIDTKLLRLLVSILMILIFAGVVFFIASRFYKTVTEEDGGNGVAVEQVSPTGVDYQFQDPSAWAEDPVVKQIEQEVGTLEREVINAIIKETNLNPPTLDFNVSF